MLGFVVAPTAPRAMALVNSSIEHESFHKSVTVVMAISWSGPVKPDSTPFMADASPS
jgi:hypothetical protein